MVTPPISLLLHLLSSIPMRRLLLKEITSSPTPTHTHTHTQTYIYILSKGTMLFHLFGYYCTYKFIHSIYILEYITPSHQSNWKLRLAFFLLAISRKQCLIKCLLYLQSCVNFSPESHAAEKRQLVNEIVSLKKMSDLRERESARRDVQVHQYKSEADKGLTALQEAERKVQNYRIEVGRRFTISMALSL